MLLAPLLAGLSVRAILVRRSNLTAAARAEALLGRAIVRALSLGVMRGILLLR